MSDAAIINLKEDTLSNLIRDPKSFAVVARGKLAFSGDKGRVVGENLCFENNPYTCGVGGGFNVVNALALLRQKPI